MSIDLVAFSQFLKRPVNEVKTELRSLEVSHAITVKTSEPSILVEILQPCSEEYIHQILSITTSHQTVRDYIVFDN